MKDLISKEAAIEATTDRHGVCIYKERLLALPAEEKTGRWIIRQDRHGRTYGECSSCGMKQYTGASPYCPYCGSHNEEVEK